MTERWLPVPEWEGLYEVSASGRVRSVDRVDTSGKRRRSKVLVPNVTKFKSTRHGKGGRHSVMLYDGSNRPEVRRLVHQLVLEAFVGLRPSPRHHACHRDDDPHNNTLVNLYWGTPEQNMADQQRNNPRTACRRGHAYTPENSSIDKTGRRHCLACRRQDAEDVARSRKWQQANPEAYAEILRQKRKEANARYLEKNRDRINAEKRAHRAAKKSN